MNEFVKSLRIKFSEDKNSYNKLKKSLNEISDIKVFDEKDFKHVKDLEANIKLLKNDIAKLSAEYEKFADLNDESAKKYAEYIETLLDHRKAMLSSLGVDIDKTKFSYDDSLDMASMGKGKGMSVGGVALTGLKAIGLAFLAGLKNVFTDAIDGMKDALEFSQLSNSQTRDLMFSYGLNNAQAYGLTQAQELVGVESFEDMMYMNPQERSQFIEAFQKYTEKYDELYESGFFEDMQDFQYEMKDFKLEMQHDVMKFFVENKDLIKAGMKAIIQIAEWIVKFFGSIVDAFSSGGRSDSERSAAVSDIISNYTNTNTTNNNSTTNNNTFNINSQNGQWSREVGQILYGQQIVAYEGG